MARRVSNRRSNKRSEMVRALQFVLAVSVFVFGLGFVSVDEPALFDIKHAAADPSGCGQGNDLTALCEYLHALGHVPDPVIPDPVIPDPVIPDPVIPDPVIPDPVIPSSRTPSSRTPSSRTRR